MSEGDINVLLIEDNPGDVRPIAEALSGSFINLIPSTFIRPGEH